MKVERSRAARSAAAVALVPPAQAVTAPQIATPANTAINAYGIPEGEFTPHVRDAVLSLTADVESLRRQLQQTQSRLDEMEQVADRDQLLPVLNRRAFVRELTRYISFAVRYGTPASLVYFDLDGFKLINDTHGHSGGDAVLEHFAQILLANVRDSDIIGRLGGDEFGVILSHANQAQAQTKAATLAQKLNESPASFQGRSIALGFSFGAFELTSGDSADLAIARADEAMYAHKRAGR